jgi:flavin reductase (DIM6/NTAB) family NADH-FMN oxidoreductase RutF
MNEKANVESALAYRFLHPMHTVLVTCVGKDLKSNIITLAWVMPTSIDPPLVAMSVSPKRHSHRLISETGEFVINIPTVELLRQVLTCGTVSGRNHDKFEETRLTPAMPKRVKVPIIKECIAHIECKLEGIFTTGDHTIFIGKVIEAYAEKGVFTEKYDLEKVRMLYHAGGNSFAVLNPKPASNQKSAF